MKKKSLVKRFLKVKRGDKVIKVKAERVAYKDYLSYAYSNTELKRRGK